MTDLREWLERFDVKSRELWDRAQEHAAERRAAAQKEHDQEKARRAQERVAQREAQRERGGLPKREKAVRSPETEQR